MTSLALVLRSDSQTQLLLLLLCGACMWDHRGLHITLHPLFFLPYTVLGSLFFLGWEVWGCFLNLPLTKKTRNLRFQTGRSLAGKGCMPTGALTHGHRLGAAPCGQPEMQCGLHQLPSFPDILNPTLLLKKPRRSTYRIGSLPSLSPFLFSSLSPSLLL